MPSYDQRGQKVNNQINISVENADKNPFQQGINALKSKSYSFAVSCFEKSFNNDGDENTDAEKHYYLALALLGGNRPRLHSLSSIHTIEEQLRLAINNNPNYSKACVLWAIVKYDYYTMNRISEKLPSALDLAKQGYLITTDDVTELLSHIQASDNKIWEWLHSR